MNSEGLSRQSKNVNKFSGQVLDEGRIFLPADIFGNGSALSECVSVVSYAYKDDMFFVQESGKDRENTAQETKQHQRLNSIILSATVLGRVVADLKNPIDLEFKLLDLQKVANKRADYQKNDDLLTCSFWKFNQHKGKILDQGKEVNWFCICFQEQRDY